MGDFFSVFLRGGAAERCDHPFSMNGEVKKADTSWVLTAYDEGLADNGNSAISEVIEGNAALTTNSKCNR